MPDSQRRTTKTLKIVPTTHSRLKDHTREGETLSGTINRALDALEREAHLPRAVTEAMHEHADSDTPTED